MEYKKIPNDFNTAKLNQRRIGRNIFLELEVVKGHIGSEAEGITTDRNVVFRAILKIALYRSRSVYSVKIYHSSLNGNGVCFANDFPESEFQENPNLLEILLNGLLLQPKQVSVGWVRVRPVDDKGGPYFVCKDPVESKRIDVYTKPETEVLETMPIISENLVPQCVMLLRIKTGAKPLFLELPQRPDLMKECEMEESIYQLYKQTTTQLLEVANHSGLYADNLSNQSIMKFDKEFRTQEKTIVTLQKTLFDAEQKIQSLENIVKDLVKKVEDSNSNTKSLEKIVEDLKKKVEADEEKSEDESPISDTEDKKPAN